MFAWQMWEDGGTLRAIAGVDVNVGVGVGVGANWCCGGRLFCTAPFHGASAWVQVLAAAVCVDGGSFCGQSVTVWQSLSRAKAPSIATSAFFALDAGFFLRDPCKLQPSSPAQASTSARANSSTSVGVDCFALNNSQSGLSSIPTQSPISIDAARQWILGFSPMHCRGTAPP